MRPKIHDPDATLSIEPTSEVAATLHAGAAAAPLAMPHASGLFSKKHRLPRDCGWLAKELDAIGEQLTQAVAEKHGSVSIYHSAVIETVLKHHKQMRLLERWLVRPLHQARTNANDPNGINRTAAIPLKERMQLIKNEAVAAESRAKAILDLGLDKSKGDEAIEWAKVFAQGLKAAAAIEATAPEGRNA